MTPPKIRVKHYALLYGEMDKRIGPTVKCVLNMPMHELHNLFVGF